MQHSTPDARYLDDFRSITSLWLSRLTVASELSVRGARCPGPLPAIPGPHRLPPPKIAFRSLSMFTSPLLYHHSLPTVRVVTDPETGRRYSVVDTGVRSLNSPYRRNTIAAVSNQTATAGPPATGAASKDPNQPVFLLRRSSLESAPVFNKGSKMSKVVRSVKNVTKGYSSVQVKVRNGMTSPPPVTWRSVLIEPPQPRPTIPGALRAPTWPKSPH